MKYGFFKIAVLAAFASMGIGQPSAFAQGSLTPPGAPAATMKTLDQVEPRTAIVSSSYIITQPGSYYLATNMTGLSIQTGDVTLDLMGFSISASGGSAIYFYGAYTNVVIRNGSLRSDMGSGLFCNNAAVNARLLIENIRVQAALSSGLLLPSGSVVRNCEIYGCGGSGIYSSGAVDVRNCILERNFSGMTLGSGSQVIGNTVRNNTGFGIRLTGTNSWVTDNIVVGTSDNYDFALGNQLNLLLSQIPETLDWPCSVKLAGTLTCTETGANGITVNANDITIDLAGHTLIGSGANSGHGIYQSSSCRNLTVLNGKAVDWRGSGLAGVYAAGSSARIQGVQAATNYLGIYTGSGSTISECVARNNLSYGIFANSGATISECSGLNNVDKGIVADLGSTVSRCIAQQNGGTGISATYGCTVSGCSATYNGSSGISATAGCTISGCSATYNTSIGIYVDSDSFVSGNTCDNNSGNSGIYVAGGDNRIMDNTATDNNRGLHVLGSGNFVARNTCSGNTTNWVVSANNVCLVVSATTGGAISGNAGGLAPGSTDPNANFTY